MDKIGIILTTTVELGRSGYIANLKDVKAVHRTQLILIFVGLITAYILFAGPIVWLSGKGYLSGNLGRIYFQPLYPLYQVPVLGNAYQRYLGLWLPEEALHHYGPPRGTHEVQSN